jgi:hypothetical protein
VTIAAEDGVIVNHDAEGIEDDDDLARHLHVGGGGRRVAGGMVVGQDNGGGGELDSVPTISER